MMSGAAARTGVEDYKKTINLEKEKVYRVLAITTNSRLITAK